MTVFSVNIAKRHDTKCTQLIRAIDAQVMGMSSTTVYYYQRSAGQY